MKKLREFTEGFLLAVAVLLVLLSILALGGCAAQVVAPPAGYCISPDVMKQCAVEGGCTLFSRARLEQLVEEVAQQACKGRL